MINERFQFLLTFAVAEILSSEGAIFLDICTKIKLPQMNFIAGRRPDA